jgi:membrane-associated phospholipid phosphatase
MRKLTLNDFKPVDIVLLAYSFLMLMLVGIFGVRLEKYDHILLVYMGSIFYTIFWVYVRLYNKSKFIDYLIAVYPLPTLIWFYEISGWQIHLFFPGFFDNIFLTIENGIFPIHPTIWFQKLDNPLLVEWMMFGYVFYLLLIPITATWLYIRNKKNESSHLVLSLMITFFLCYIGFVLLPVEGPRFALKSQYTVIFHGYLFKSFADMIEHNAMLHGGCFPSAHCAAATVMLLLSFKYDKKLFYWICPIIITLYFATVYGRYHYPLDVIGGMITAVIGIRLSQPLAAWWAKVASQSTLNAKQPERANAEILD